VFGIGFPELLVILALALVVIGPRRLPDIAKALGRALGEFKRATDEFKQTLNEETRATEIREQIMKGGKIYPPEANRPAATPDTTAAADNATGVNPKPASLGPLASAAVDRPQTTATSEPTDPQVTEKPDDE
jgi:Tat protein translocase TatB subunit